MKKQLYNIAILSTFLFIPTLSKGQTEIKESGYTNITEANFGLGLGLYRYDYSYGIQTINGYLFNPHFSIGFGIGIDKYKYLTTIPLFIDLRANILKKKTTPLISTAIGYSLMNPQQDIKVGLFINPAIGIKFFVTKKTALNFSLGYRLQERIGIFYNYNSKFDVSSYSSFFNLKFGATF